MSIQENPLWENSLVQFARLLAEINATCEISEHDWTMLLESMGISHEGISELFERANRLFEIHKSIASGHMFASFKCPHCEADGDMERVSAPEIGEFPRGNIVYNLRCPFCENYFEIDANGSYVDEQ